jgi:predicted nucleotidyltransferase
VIDALRAALASDQRVAYALLFGAAARGTDRGDSDLDVALGLKSGVRLSAAEFGELTAQLEAAAGRPVDLVLMDEAPPAVAYRAFRDGAVVAVADRASFVDRKAKAILEYLDFRWVEEACTRGVLAAAARGR